MTQIVHKPIAFAEPRIEQTDLPGGGFIWRSVEPLQNYPQNLCARLHHWADAAGDRIFLAERDGHGGWRRLSYAQALAGVRSVAAALLAQGLNHDTPVMMLSDNAIDNALLLFAGMYAGVPVAPISPAYSLMSQDHAKLKGICELLQPRLVYASDGQAYARAIAALPTSGCPVVVSANADAVPGAGDFSAMLATPPGAEVDRAFEAVGPETVGKILFTSGSTGLPKGVLNTHRMMCANQQAMAQVWPFLAERTPVIVDWLPWNHTFGGNHNLNMMLWHGGTLYIDNGKPAPGLIERTIANLREVASTIYFNVPRGFDMILPYLEKDEALRDTFFRELDLIFYAAAALPQNLWERLEKQSVASTGKAVAMTSSWGATETAPALTSAHFPIERAGVIGVPIPGTEIKFLPNGGKLEMRVRGPQIMPGYFKRPDLTAAAFDEAGFYKIGDAGKPANATNPSAGVIFDGRVAEDFKLSSGTWVSVGTLRVAAITAMSPLVQDAVVTGHDRDRIGLLLFPNPPACAQVAGLPADTPLAELTAHPGVRAAVAEGLRKHNADHAGSSQRIDRALFLASPPSIDANEITDKGYINQRAVLTARADAVQALYAGGTAVIFSA
ncbi:MAG: feruloyl-CoA synthase [Burkholderiaceae bacterium]